ncbi:MAG: lysozyme [Solirubrobacterales bacterium]|nr:lysozyme [Solirubrobacterales bacterium]
MRSLHPRIPASRLPAIAAGVVATLISAAAANAEPSGGTNLSTPAHTAYLQAHAPGDHMGWEIPQSTGPGLPALAAVPFAATANAASTVRGLDVSGYQGNVNWSSVKSNGAKFAYVKATEGTYYTNPYFSQQYDGSYNAGLIRGAYAFGVPSYSSGASQADYLVNHGGAWSADGKTLPGLLDIEYNPNGAECYGLSKSQMVSWIRDFVNTYHAKTSRWPTIYSTLDWWSTCTGNSAAFASNDPLFIARYASTPGTLPAGWSFYTFWQYADSGTFPGDQDVFNGTQARLVALATNSG